MRTSITLHLNQLVEIEHAIAHDKRPGLSRRAAAIRLLHLGNTPAQAANRLGCSAKTVRLWRQRFRAEGLEGLADRPRTGRPLKGDRHYQQALQDALSHDPETLGYPFRSWTVTRLREHLARQTGIALSDGRMRDLLHRLGYHYQRCQRRTAWPQDAFLNRLHFHGYQVLWTWTRVNVLTERSLGA